MTPETVEIIIGGTIGLILGVILVVGGTLLLTWWSNR